MYPGRLHKKNHRGVLHHSLHLLQVIFRKEISQIPHAIPAFSDAILGSHILK